MSALRQRLSTPVVAVLALGALVGCGDGDSGSGQPGTPEQSPSAFDAATASLSDTPFCDEVDTTLVAGALSTAADAVTLVSERVVDQARQGAGERLSRVNSCTFGSGPARLVVAVQPERAETAVARRVASYRDECRVTDDPWFGSPGVVAECGADGGRRSVAVVGLVGGSGFFCTSVVGTGAGGATDLRDATVEVCRDTMETVGAPG